MTETQKSQQIHIQASLGEKLSESERWALEHWYEELDCEESIINQNNRQIDLESMRKQLEDTTAQVIGSSRKVVALLKQNEKIRRENTELRRQIEASLTVQGIISNRKIR